MKMLKSIIRRNHPGLVAICPVDGDCPWVRKTQRATHAHIVAAHPEVLHSPEEARATGQMYVRDIWVAWKRAA